MNISDFTMVFREKLKNYSNLFKQPIKRFLWGFLKKILKTDKELMNVSSFFIVARIPHCCSQISLKVLHSLWCFFFLFIHFIETEHKYITQNTV